MPLTTSEIQALDSAHYMHPFTDHKALAEKGARVITRGEGVYIWDSEGNKILDGMSGLWCVNVGYGRKELVEAAVKQMEVLPYYNSFFQTTNVPAVQLADRIIKLAGERYSHVLFGSSGSESNDTIVRMVRHYWTTLGQPERSVIISRKNAYHGSTMCGASLGGMSGMHAQGGLPIPGIVHIEQPYHFGLAPDQDKDAFGIEAAGWLEQKILEVGADKVAAFIGEPVQGAGGVIIPPKTYWPEIQRICDKYGILLICDEVICGFGRLGAWFGSELMGAKPDLMTFAKGVTSGYIPLGGVVVGKRVAEVLIEKGGEFNHGYTYSGHPVACAVALANLDLIEKEGLVERVRDETGPHLAHCFAALAEHPLVAGAETFGMVAGLVLMKDKHQHLAFDEDLEVGMICRKHCFAHGLIMRAVGDRMIVAPPLAMTKEQIDEMVRLIRLCLDATLQELKERGYMD
ncbi:aspartate aminotransferase family protein [Sulfuriferula nivalis]|uniref:Aspartate aminotransferase family protein n=1 Tax=Sulfuriferula nivalis TaxID=2675298 RepID=A0A809RD85_9PROT|nr:aspartate aminotransferase family protein [Sulfuriferula nivalis]BBO99615.1 aspartate aminotransferase family protein [Sulfuriferula nivalis]